MRCGAIGGFIKPLTVMAVDGRIAALEDVFHPRANVLFRFRVREDVKLVVPDRLEDGIGDFPGGIPAATRWRRASHRAADAGSSGSVAGKCPGRFRADSMIRVLTIPGQSTETLTLAPRSASSW